MKEGGTELCIDSLRVTLWEDYENVKPGGSKSRRTI